MICSLRSDPAILFRINCTQSARLDIHSYIHSFHIDIRQIAALSEQALKLVGSRYINIPNCIRIVLPFHTVDHPSNMCDLFQSAHLRKRHLVTIHSLVLRCASQTSQSLTPVPLTLNRGNRRPLRLRGDHY